MPTNLVPPGHIPVIFAQIKDSPIVDFSPPPPITVKFPDVSHYLRVFCSG
jgi:hypothetical protein